jgi:hypothetical protein
MRYSGVPATASISEHENSFHSMNIIHHFCKFVKAERDGSWPWYTDLRLVCSLEHQFYRRA